MQQTVNFERKWEIARFKDGTRVIHRVEVYDSHTERERLSMEKVWEVADDFVYSSILCEYVDSIPDGGSLITWGESCL